ncbi:TonB-dependent receptor [Pseudoalteromonas sp. MMG013]|uniref:TonB-dependent receptor n=1 Tax=Pseudoalteromonas sp. MMG013 TaxID=2822687 RepID=UPI001B388722|nr:TonB-dependent receptor [Pseudoalteromonas sp. MMG013]MBQ4864270.1 TonB-dependent receptor [Pseudoalteromonas sp. MMG013]
MVHRRYSLFLLKILLFPTLLLANTPQQTSDNTLEKIQIRGFHDSVVKSLNNKRFSDQITDSISAQEIGKFPDKNVAEALQRITGISLSRIQGEGERVGVRGTTPEQNRTYLNGQYLASADWWISSQPNRGFNFTLLPADIIASLEVYKTPQADQDEGSLGGAINIKTLDPLLTDNRFLVLNTQLQYNDLSKELDPQLSVIFNYKNPNEDFAALFTATQNKRQLRRDGLESWGWHERNYQFDNNHDLVPVKKAANENLSNIWTPGGGGSAIFNQERILSTVSANFAYKFNHHWQLNTHLLHSELQADNTNQNFLWQPAKVLDLGGKIKGAVLNKKTLTYGQYSQLENEMFNTSMEAIWRNSKIRTQSIHFDLLYSGPVWQTQYQIGFSHAQGGTSEDSTSQFSANTQFSVDTRQEQNIIAQYDISPLDAQRWFLTEARKDAQHGDDKAHFAQIDSTYQLEHPVISSIQVGLKYREHQRDFRRLRSINGGLNGLAGQLNTTLANYPAAVANDFLHDIGNEQTLKQYSFVNIAQLNNDFESLGFVQTVERASRFNIEERTLAGYFKLALDSDFYRLNLGVRAVSTWQNAAALKQLPVNSVNTELKWVNDKKSYLDLLPSINLNIELADDVVSRFSFARVMSRAQFNHLMPSTNYNVTQAQGQGGNPDLDPYRATQFDASIEWYFQEGGLTSAAVFNKNVDSFIEFKRELERHENILMSIDRPINGNGGSVRGVELSYQQYIAYGFGIITNYTYVDGTRVQNLTSQKDRVPGTSKHSFNITAYYEDHFISTRLAYNFRTEFATGVGETITDDYGQLDGNVTLSVTPKIKITFDFINLTNEILYSYERNMFAPTGIYSNGRRFYIGVRYQL